LTIAQAEAQLQSLQSQQGAAVEAYNQGQIALTQAQQDADTAKGSVERQQKKVDEAAKQLSTLARAAYMTGGIDPVTGLLSGQGSASVVNRIGSLDQIARVRSAQSIALKSQQTALASLQITSKQKLATAQAAAKQLTDQRDQVQKLIDQQDSVIDHLQAEAKQQFLAKQAAERKAAADALKQVQAQAQAQAQTKSGPVVYGASVPASGRASVVVAAAMSQLSKPYRYAGAGPGSYDCSGLTMWAFAKAGVSLPHSSQAQYGIGQRISRGNLQSGDLVFFREGGTIGHVGIYVGGGNMIDANHTGGWVGIRPLYDNFVGGTRI
jgi:cell wall-associated NlpC family hydrolase